MEALPNNTEKQWFAMRDLKRVNAKLPAYKQLAEAGMEVFTPMTTRLVVKDGKSTRVEVPVMQDLLFVNESRQNLDPIVAKTPTLQYRFKKGGKQGEAITIPAADMSRFIDATQAANNPKYYSADEISPLLCGRKIRMIGGPLEGHEGNLQTVRGSKTKQLIITLPSLLAVSVDINDEYIEVL